MPPKAKTGLIQFSVAKRPEFKEEAHAVGVAVADGAHLIGEHGRNVPNEYAPYQGLLVALELAAEYGFTEIVFQSCSSKVINQMNSNTPIQINALNALVETARQKVASSMFSQHCKFETIDQTDNSAAQRIAFRTLDFGDMIVSYARGAKTMERALPNEPILVAFDGASRGNPGPAAAAAVIYTTKTSKVGMVPDQVLVEESELLNGNRTSNQAEYEALIVGLKRASLLKAKNVICQGDSELVIRQVSVVEGS